MTNLHYIADEQLGGGPNGHVEREYAEVERKANVGDYVIVKRDGFNLGYYAVGDIFSVCESIGKGVKGYNEKAGMFFLINDEFTPLDPTGSVRIDGTVYRMVERNAAVGEKVLAIKFAGHVSSGEVMTVEIAEHSDGSIWTVSGAFFDTEIGDKYAVLEPADELTQSTDLSLTEADVRNNPRQVIDLIANLALRVTTLEKGAGRLSKLESKVERLGTANQQAYDIVSRNVETWAQEFEEFKAQQSTSSALKLDSIERERESTGRNTVSISFYGNPTAKELAEKLSDVFAGTLTAEERREL